MIRVYIKLPKTGLGNMLLVWARGVVFANLNGLEYITSSWWGFRWGALIRREQRNRLYWKYFKETSWLKRSWLKFFLNKKMVYYEPLVRRIDDLPKKIFVFNTIVTGNDLFDILRDHKEFLIRELENMLVPAMKRRLYQYEFPVIGVHIRRGDFKLGNQTTPIAYFIDGIRTIRSAIGEEVPVTVFTDAASAEIKEVLELPHIYLADSKPDILDLLLLSKSQIMLLSRSSTFGYWAAFLSDALIIRPANDWQTRIALSDKGDYKEVLWDAADSMSTERLVQAIYSRGI